MPANMAIGREGKLKPPSVRFVAMRYEKASTIITSNLLQGIRRVERVVPRPGDCHSGPGQAAAPQCGGEHQGEQFTPKGLRYGRTGERGEIFIEMM